MKKIFLILVSIISPFFFNTLVYALTGSYFIQNTYTAISSDVDSIISSSTSYGISINKPYFIIRYRNSSFTVLFTDSPSNFKINFSYPSCGVNLYPGISSYYSFSNNSFTFLQDLTTADIVSFSSSSSLVDSNCVTDYSFIYSNFSLYRYNSNMNTHIFDSSGTEFSFVNSNDIPVPSLVDIYGTPPEPPVPPDSFPLLTSFYTLVVDKLVDICSYITSSYLFLSIFVIFTFYFVILLLRRLL